MHCGYMVPGKQLLNYYDFAKIILNYFELSLQLYVIKGSKVEQY